MSRAFSPSSTCATAPAPCSRRWRCGFSNAVSKVAGVPARSGGVLERQVLGELFEELEIYSRWVTLDNRPAALRDLKAPAAFRFEQPRLLKMRLGPGNPAVDNPITPARQQLSPLGNGGLEVAGNGLYRFEQRVLQPIPGQVQDQLHRAFKVRKSHQSGAVSILVPKQPWPFARRNLTTKRARRTVKYRKLARPFRP